MSRILFELAYALDSCFDRYCYTRILVEVQDEDVKTPMQYRYELIETDPVYRGFLKVNRYRLQHELYLGGKSDELIRERLEQRRAVSVLLCAPRLNQVVLVDQFRIGAVGKQRVPWAQLSYLFANSLPRLFQQRHSDSARHFRIPERIDKPVGRK